MKKQVAILSGITGQDGYYLSNFLLDKGYEVHGIYRRTVEDIDQRMKHLDKRVKLHEGDLIDIASLIKIIKLTNPDEVYNLGSQAYVPSSWTQPIATAQITGMGVLNMLEAIRQTNIKIKFYQASTSEMIAQLQTSPEPNKILFHPRSPYGCAKMFGHYITQNYRESYDMFACSGVLYNHESWRRGSQFVTRKITKAVARIKLGLQETLELGNFNAQRDWGFAGDYVEAMWLMLQQDKPKDYVIAMNEAHSVREFVEEAFKVLDMSITWEGEGINEVGKHNGKVIVKVNPKFYRPAEIDVLLGDYSKAEKELGWKPKTRFKDLVKMMVENDLKEEAVK